MTCKFTHLIDHEVTRTDVRREDLRKHLFTLSGYILAHLAAAFRGDKHGIQNVHISWGAFVLVKICQCQICDKTVCAAIKIRGLN